MTGSALAEFTHQGFGGMRQRFQARQAEEAASALDGVNEAENVGQDVGVVWFLLETHKLDVDNAKTSRWFPSEIRAANRPLKLALIAGTAPAGRHLSRVRQCVGKAFNFRIGGDENRL